MKNLEEILQVYFGCKRPFRMSDGKLSATGQAAYSRLIMLIEDVCTLTEDDSAPGITERLDEILRDSI